MSKKLTLTLTAVITALSLTIFTLANAFALEGSDQDSKALTSVKQLCKELRANTKAEYKNIETKGLTGPVDLTQEEIDNMTDEEFKKATKDAIKKAKKDYETYVKLACNEAQTAAKLCKKLRLEYKGKVADIKAQGLAKTDEAAAIAALKAERKAACDKVVTLTSPIQMCTQASIPISSSLTGEALEKLKTDNDKYKKKVCKEAAADKKTY